ncbi:hypothetical protein CHUAL_002375 [Chamberlinius hualienensis]
MATEIKSNRNRNKEQDGETSMTTSSRSSYTKDVKLKSKSAYLSSPYLQSLLPVPPKQLVKNHHKTGSKVSRLSRATTSLNVNAVNQKVASHKPDKKIQIDKFLRDVSFKQRPLTSLNCQMTLKFVSNNSACLPGRSHQICVLQQHCGGNPITVYQGWHIYGDKFTFTSKRQQGYPFSVTLIINNLLNLQLSACCEYKYQHGRKLGGGKSQFILLSVNGSFPCYRCQMRRNQTTGSTASTQSSENSKADGYESECSNDREMDNCENYQNDYEDDFEEENEEPVLKFGEELCPVENTILVKAETNEPQSESQDRSKSEKSKEIQTPHIAETEQVFEMRLEDSVKRVEEIDRNTESNNTPELSIEQQAAALMNLQHLCINESSEDEKEARSYAPSSSPQRLKPDDEMKKENDQVTEELNQEHSSAFSIQDKESSSDDDDHTNNDDAEQTVTSDSEPTTNSDTDEDVCYSYEAPPPAANFNQRDNSDFFHVDTSVHHKTNIHYDSSDEEDDHLSPQITIWADVHACEIESPAISKI